MKIKITDSTKLHSSMVFILKYSMSNTSKEDFCLLIKKKKNTKECFCFEGMHMSMIIYMQIRKEK